MKLVYRRYLQTVALIWVSCFVLLSLVYVTVLAPQKRSLEQYEEQLVEKRRICEAAQRAAREETKAELNEQMEQLQGRLKDFVVDFEDSADLTFDIGRIAKENKVTSFSIEGGTDRTRSDMPDCNHISEDYMSVSVSAGFHQFAAFLNALERHRPVIFVDNFTITRSKKGDSDHPVTMELAVFVRKPQDNGATNAI
ncbi:MAG: GspMb/PilO family protein [Planctomycetota bacterium]|jgi:Tfp pilus assembly protein PilO